MFLAFSPVFTFTFLYLRDTRVVQTKGHTQLTGSPRVREGQGFEVRAADPHPSPWGFSQECISG